MTNVVEANGGLFGVWRLVSARMTLLDSGEVTDLLGAASKGYAVFHPSGRMMVILTAAGRTAPGGPGMTAYTGRFRVEGNRLITSVDVAWVPAWEGTGAPVLRTGRQQAYAVLGTEPQRPAAGRAESGPRRVGARRVAESRAGFASTFASYISAFAKVLWSAHRARKSAAPPKVGQPGPKPLLRPRRTTMALTRSFRETVAKRAKDDPAFRAALVEQAMQNLVDGEMGIALAQMRDVVNAAMGLDALAAETGIQKTSLMRMSAAKGIRGPTT